MNFYRGLRYYARNIVLENEVQYATLESLALS